MSSVELLTFQDVLDHLNDFQDANPSARSYRFARRATFEAMRDLAQAHHWSYLYKQDWINTVAPYETGTIEYDHTGGTYERQLTLTDGTFPTWAADGTIRISNVDYVIARRVDDNIAQLDIRQNPLADVAAGTSYTLYQDRYVLPADLWTIDHLVPDDSWGEPEFVHPREWLSHKRYSETASNYPIEYTVMGSNDYQGVMEAAFYPYPDSARTIAFIYSRRPRRVTVEGSSVGTVSVSANSATVTGTDTAFTDAMVGSLIRLSSTSNELPVGRSGANPFAVERSIIAVGSGTSLTLDQVVDSAYSGVKYMISDPIDIDVGVMGSALYRCAEAHLGRMLRLSDRKQLDADYGMALIRAKEADSRSTAPRAVGGSRPMRRLAFMPTGSDVD